MPYTEAIEYLKANDIRKDDGTFYEFGEVRFKFVCPVHVINVETHHILLHSAG